MAQRWALEPPSDRLELRLERILRRGIRGGRHSRADNYVLHSGFAPNECLARFLHDEDDGNRRPQWVIVPGGLPTFRRPT